MNFKIQYDSFMDIKKSNCLEDRFKLSRRPIALRGHVTNASFKQ